MDEVESITEDFHYDIMNRLVHSDLSGTGTDVVALFGADSTTYTYDVLGNLKSKSDVAGGGEYVYGDPASGHAGPHAVTLISGLGAGLESFTYDANGNQRTGNGRTNYYTPFNKPYRISKDGQDTRLWYGPERQLMRQLEDTPNGREVTRYVGGLYEESFLSGRGTIKRHHIAVAGQPIAVVETAGSSLVPTKEHYLHKNHQSSVIAITDMNGEVVERRHYDAFGNIKNMLGSSTAYQSWLGFDAVTDLSFTGHRALQTAGVIHMRGRVYDPQIGRFLSADPHIQSPLNSQSLNRYSYTLNNPLSWTDPSGYFFKSLFKAVKKLFKAIGKIIKKVARAIGKIVKAIGKTIKKIGKFIWEQLPVILDVVALFYPPLQAVWVGIRSYVHAAHAFIRTGSVGSALLSFASAGGRLPLSLIHI